MTLMIFALDDSHSNSIQSYLVKHEHTFTRGESLWQFNLDINDRDTCIKLLYALGRDGCGIKSAMFNGKVIMS